MLRPRRGRLPPDAVAASAVLKRLSLPSRLTATLQGGKPAQRRNGLVLLRAAAKAILKTEWDRVRGELKGDVS